MSVMMPMSVAVLMHMGVALDVAAAREHENVPARVHDLDLRSVKPRQHRRGYHFIDSAEHRLPTPQIEYAVERADQLAQFVRRKHDRDPALAADLANDIDGDFLV